MGQKMTCLNRDIAPFSDDERREIEEEFVAILNEMIRLFRALNADDAQGHIGELESQYTD
jgi:hypothetical protein